MLSFLPIIEFVRSNRTACDADHQLLGSRAVYPEFRTSILPKVLLPSMSKRPLVLTILDGWGYRAETANNAIALAKKPTYDKLLREFPNTLIRASEHFVGLPDGQMGNSEVGHLNIGAGRIVQMDITRIDALIAANEFSNNPKSSRPCSARARAGGNCISSGWSPTAAFTRTRSISTPCCAPRARYGVTRVFVHAFMDGRDTGPNSGAGYIAQLEQKMREYGVGKIASVNGRYYAMDRDKRWERERKAFDAMVNGKAEGGAYRESRRRASPSATTTALPTSSPFPLWWSTARASRSGRFATRMCASTSTSAPTARGRSHACWRARAA